MRNHVFVTQGDLSQMRAHAVGFSTGHLLDGAGHMASAFRANLPGFEEGYAALRNLPRWPPPGSSHWVPINNRRAPQGVVVTVATGGEQTLLELSQSAVRSSIQTAVEALRRSVPKEERLLVALPTFLAGKGGGRRERIELAKAQVQTAYDVLDTMANVDVAFVAYTETNQHLYLNARSEVMRGRPVDPDEPDVDDGLVHALRAGECVLFVGSGLSQAAGLPSWAQLIKELAKDLGITATATDLDYYLDLAEWHRERFREEPNRTLPALIHDLFGDTTQTPPTLAHYLLAGLPLRQVVTTNWDDLVERSMRALRQPTCTVVREEEIPLTGRSDGPCVVKMHGCAVAQRGIVMGRDDYETFFDTRPAMALLLQGLLLNQTFFFVGYSLRDPNFRQIYSRIAVMLQGAKRPAFATTFDLETDHPRRQWARKQLNLVPFNGDERNQRFLRWLDKLAERVAGTPQVFLASSLDGEGQATLGKLRTSLLASAEEVKQLCSRPLASDEARQVARTLEFLVGEGWRPNTRAALWNLWLQLARRITDDDVERERLMRLALRHTESLDDAALVQQEIDGWRARKQGG